MNKAFWRAALIRAARTVAQAALAMIPAAATIQQVNWLTVLSTAALAGVVSVLTSIATGLPETDIPAPDVRVVYLDEDGEQIPEEEANCPVKVKAYSDYTDDGSPIVDCNGETCDLSQYVDGGEDDGDA
mgnify:FL=1